jgi:hypothetical protein
MSDTTTLLEATDEDFKYLSRFIVTKFCLPKKKQHKHVKEHEYENDIDNEKHTYEVVNTWNEWIEPLSVHGRHPFSGNPNPSPLP